MPVSEDVRKRYAKAIDAVQARYNALDQATVRDIRSMLKNVRGEVATMLLESPTEFGEFRLTQMKQNLDTLIADFDAKAKGVAYSRLKQANDLGFLLVTDPLQELGDVQLSAMFFRPSEAQLNVLVDYTADLITNISYGMNVDISRQISLAGTGLISRQQAMKEINTILGIPPTARGIAKGISFRAETIYRTEMNRAYNIASASQREELAKYYREIGPRIPGTLATLKTGEEPALMQQWMATGDGRTRIAHLKAHGQTVPIGTPFIVGGEELRYPLDPLGSAGNTINCRCTVVLVPPGQDKLKTPLDAKIEAEKDRRKKADDEKLAKGVFTQADKLAKAKKELHAKGISELKVPQNRKTRMKIRFDQRRLKSNLTPRGVSNVNWATTELYNKGSLRMRVPTKVVGQIIRDGRFKNQFETQTSEGYLGNDTRYDVEQKMFGIESRAPQDHPVYGYITAPQLGYYDTDTWVEQYGDVRIIFKDSVKDRTSISYGDSLAPGEKEWIVPTPLNDPHPFALTKYAWSYGTAGWSGVDPTQYDDIDRSQGLGEAMRTKLHTEYTEAQIHGEVTLDDIERVEILRRDVTQIPALILEMEEAGVNYKIYDTFQEFADS